MASSKAESAKLPDRTQIPADNMDAGLTHTRVNDEVTISNQDTIRAIAGILREKASK